MLKLMRARLKNRLIFEIGTKKLKNLLDQVQPKNLQQYLDRKTINI